MAPLPRQQLKNILAGLSADGHKTGRVPLRLFKSNEKTLHQLSMLAAEILRAFHAAGLQPTDFERTSVLYRLVAHLATRRRLRFSAGLRQRIRLVGAYIAKNPAHLKSETTFSDLLIMARHTLRAPRKQTPEDQHWALKPILQVCGLGLDTTCGVTVTAFACVGFCIMPLLIVSPQQFGQSSLVGWRALLAAPECGGDCRIPTPPREHAPALRHTQDLGRRDHPSEVPYV